MLFVSSLMDSARKTIFFCGSLRERGEKYGAANEKILLKPSLTHDKKCPSLTFFTQLCHLQLIGNIPRAGWLCVKKNDVQLFAKMDHNFDYLRVLNVEDGEILVFKSRRNDSDASGGNHNLK